MSPGILINPLFPKRCKKGSEERGRETGIKDGLGDHNLRRRTRERGDRVGICLGEEGVIQGVDEELHVCGSHIVRIWLELRLDDGYE